MSESVVPAAETAELKEEAITTQTPETEATPPAKPPRMMSIDALRGFDMFWIVGGKPLFVAFLLLFSASGELPEWLQYQFDHVKWEGFSAWDLIMPLFLFISGASIPFAMRLKEGETRDYRAFYLRLARRIVLLWIFGMIAQGRLLTFDWTQFRFFSNTLQAIAVGYLVAVLAHLYLSTRGQIALCAGVLIVYWALMMFMPVPGDWVRAIEPRMNLALWLDDFILRRFRDGTTYAWILPGLGFAGSVMLGVFGGMILRLKEAPLKRFAYLFALGLACLLGGWLWSFHFPIIKHIWTSSMVLWAGGLSYLLLAVFYLVMDIWGYRRWAYPFMIIGANAIAAYMAGQVIPFHKVASFFPGLSCGCAGAEFISAFIGFMVLWIPLWIMHKYKIFLRV
ncbi:MAG: DUF5009 domain-containing protein [Candidatus Hydrogenedens sp.]|jgi:predicted acyltransferase|nr:DUF5009 domain-containing protein [Candidatus Hydrogenedens sp.]